MAYSFDMGRVHFVQLQNYPIYTRGFSGYWTSRGKKYSVEITSSLDWLEHDLAAARNRGQAIILNYHDTNGNWKSRFNPTNALSMLLYTEQAKRFSAMLKTYAVSAIFAGHYHKWIGPRKPQVGDGLDYGDIPIYYSGSASQGTFLEVTFRGDTMSVAPKRVSIGPNVFPPKIKVEDVSATTSITLKQEIPPTPFP
jgi:cytolysin (calcineurin-like family phosphatase)